MSGPRKGSGFPARVQRLVRQRAGYRCEACGTWVIGRSGGACLPVVRDGAGSASASAASADVPAGVPADVLSSAANAVLLCAPCASRAEALDPGLEALGFRVRGGDPRHVPMTLSRDGQRTVWRSVDGAYLTEPPALKPPALRKRKTTSRDRGSPPSRQPRRRGPARTR